LQGQPDRAGRDDREGKEVTSADPDPPQKWMNRTLPDKWLALEWYPGPAGGNPA